MNTFTVILLAVAVALTTFPAFVNGGYLLGKEKAGIQGRFILIMAMVQLLLIALGIVLGLNVGRISESSNKIMSLSILMIVGLKVIFDSLRTKPQDKSFDTADAKVLLLFAIAESIVPMAVAISVGLLAESFFKSWSIFIIVLVPVFIAGFLLGKNIGAESLKMRTGPIGGLFLIAASLIMIINLIGY